MRLEPFLHDQAPNPVSGDLTIDEIVGQNARRTPHALALVSPDLPFSGTWREVDGAVSALAHEFAGWSLGDDAVVGVQLGSSAVGALTCLALWRAGLIPAMLPLAWRRREIASALACVGATAIVTAVEVGGARLSEDARGVAAAIDTIRFLGSFGPDAPDGATPLDQTLAAPAAYFERPDRPEDAPHHVAIVTFDAGGVPVPRTHCELLAAGVTPLVTARMTHASSLVSTIDLASLAGLSTGLAPWVTAGCAAAFHQPSSTEALRAAALEIEASHIALPGRLAAGLIADCAFETLRPTVTAVWRAPDGRGAAAEIESADAVVDVHVIGELGVHAAARLRPDRHAALPLGPSGADGLELLDVKVTSEGLIALRGAVCPQAPCPAAPGAPKLIFGPDGYLETGITAVADRAAQRVSLGGKRRGVLQIGGLAVAAADLDAAYRRSGAGPRPAALPDPVFGARLALTDGGGEAVGRAAAAIEAAGFSPALAPVEREASFAQEIEPQRRSA